MAGKKETKVTSKRRTKVKELPKEEKRLSTEELKKVKGGGWLMTPAGNAKPDGGGK